ncbi:MAG TPA: YqaA family protein [Candidatus Kapabacteria bacterium]|nr:YqaA family protein [Candidatus Kapabacteria bacterium]
MNWIKKIYDWVLDWEKSPYSKSALFLLAFIESIFFPVPPDVLLIALSLGNAKKAMKFAAICTLGSVSGAMIGYAMGHYSWLTSSGEFTSFANFFFNNIPGFTHELYYSIKEMFEKWNFWVIFTAGFTPIPYKVFTVTAGVFSVNFFMFVIASIISRAGRFFLVAFLIWKFGPSIKSFIDKYFNILALAFTILLIGGFVVIQYAL